jgi:hypothetical protein
MRAPCPGAETSPSSSLEGRSWEDGHPHTGGISRRGIGAVAPESNHEKDLKWFSSFVGWGDPPFSPLQEIPINKLVTLLQFVGWVKRDFMVELVA